MPEPNKPATSQGTVPEADFLRVKKSLESAVKQRDSRIAELESRLGAIERDKKEAEFSAGLASLDDPTRLAALRKTALSEKLALEAERKAIETDKAELAKAKLTAAKAKFVEQYKVDPKVLEDAESVEQAELLALRAAVAPKEQTPGTKVDRGGAASPDVSALTATQKIALGLQLRKSQG